MTPEEQKKREEELNRFWSMDNLTPVRKKLPASSRSTDTAEIVLEPPASSDRQKEPEIRTFLPKPESRTPSAEAESLPGRSREQEKAPAVTYTPQHSLVQSVRLSGYRSFPIGHASFVRDAKRLFAAEGAPCERTTFFSYVPQYSQMNRAQLEWYLWWRHEFRRGIFLPTDYSYLILFITEVLNFPEQIPPAEGQNVLCTLWAHYRDTFEQLDHYLPEWICDYSLIHRLPAPQMELSCLRAAIKNCTFREFYVSADGEDGDIRALLFFCSSYDYRKSRFCTPENLPLFDRILPGALRTIRTGTLADGTPFDLGSIGTERHILRRSYEGILTLDVNRYRIEADYRSYFCPTEWRALITDILKYAENAIRASLGVRSRLAVRNLPIGVRQELDSWLRQNLPLPQKELRPRRTDPEDDTAYAALYDLPRKEFSLQNAAQIEAESWETTRRLVEAFEETAEGTAPAFDGIAGGERSASAPVSGAKASVSIEETVVHKTPASIPPAKEPESSSDPPTSSAFSRYLSFLRAVANRSTDEQRRAAGLLGSVPDAVADRINELATGLYGDILLEEGENGYEVIADYSDLFQSLLQ